MPAHPQDASPRPMTRRQALKGEWLLKGRPGPAAIAPGKPAPTPLRSPQARDTKRAAADPALPALGIIVLNRLAFGPRPGDLAAFNALGVTDAARLTAWVDQQLNPNAIDDSACTARITAAGLPTLGKTLQQLWADHYNGDESRTQPAEDVTTATFLRAVYSKRQLKEVMADFWHNHFSVYAWDYSYASATWVHYDQNVIRANLFGNFRTLLGAVAKSPAMLFYLDNYINQVAGYNENFGRELFELHTLGTENYLGVVDPFSIDQDLNGTAIGYCDNDVYESARSFTGWTVHDGHWEKPADVDDGTFFYFPTWHDKANKIILGHYFPANQADEQDGQTVLDLLATHPGTARYVCRKICRRLVSDAPSQELVDAAAAVFLANTAAPNQIGLVVRAIVLSPEFAATWGQKIKRPFEAAAGVLRASAAEFTPSNSFHWYFQQAGQDLFSRRSPDGYPDKKENWSNTNSLLQRWRLVNYMTQGYIDDTTLDFQSQMPGSLTTPNEIVDFWINRLLSRPMEPASSRDEVLAFLAQGRNPDFDLPPDQLEERLPHMCALILMSPDFQWR
jgi:uncharacterized protein (DUF1800 family)